MALVPRVLSLLAEQDSEHIDVFVGGIIPEEDSKLLLELGVRKIYGPGSDLNQIVSDIQNSVSTSQENTDSD